MYAVGEGIPSSTAVLAAVSPVAGGDSRPRSVGGTAGVVVGVERAVEIEDTVSA